MTTSDILTLIGGIGFLILFIGVIVGFVINIFYLKNVRKFLNYLKEKYPEAWKTLGEPTIFANNSPRNSLRVWWYINKEEYKTLGDAELIKIGSNARKLLRFTVPYFIVLAVLFVIVISCIVSSKYILKNFPSKKNLSPSLTGSRLRKLFKNMAGKLSSVRRSHSFLEGVCAPAAAKIHSD